MNKVVSFPEKRKVNPPINSGRRSDAELGRTRSYLTHEEVMALHKAVKKTSRNPIRDQCAILLLYHHGLRVSELLNLQWSHVFLEGRRQTIYIERLKNGKSKEHDLERSAIIALRKLSKISNHQYLFVSERGQPMSPGATRYMVRKAGEAAKIPIPVTTHMLRHSCGYAIAEDGESTRYVQEWLGHRNISNTVRYTELQIRGGNRFDKKSRERAR